MKFLKLFTLFIFIFSQKIHAQNTDDYWIINGLKTSEYQLTAAAQLFKDSMKCPRSIDEKGNVILVKPKDWTSGFFPGSLWIMYELTGNENLKKEAQKYTALLSNIQYYKGSHDVGFILY